MSGWGRLSVGALLSAALIASCKQTDSEVVVNIDADPGLAAVMQLRATLSNAGMGDVRAFPETPATTALSLPTAFSIDLDRSRTGALDVALDGLGAGGAVVANGAATVMIDPGKTVSVELTLHAGASLCGNGQLDSGEPCDDGDRVSSGSCDFLCRVIGSGGAGGTGGSAGTGGGQAGTGGTSGGAAGTTGGMAGGGAAGTGGGAGTSGGGAGIGGGGMAGTSAGSAGTSGGRGGGGAAGAVGGRGGNGAAGATGGRGGNTAGVGGGVGGRGGSAGSTGVGGSGAGGAGGGACTVELLINGNFEAGNVGWTTTTSGRALIYHYTDVDPGSAPPPQSLYYAWLGYNVDSETEILSQQIAIPSNALSFTVSGSYYINSDEDPTVAYDYAFVETLVGTRVDQEEKWSNVNATTAWTTFSVTRSANGFAGSTATFQARSVLDDGTNTNFFFDNLSFTANLCN